MTKDANLKKVARRHAQETGQRYTDALANLEGVRARVGWRRWSDDGRSAVLHEAIAERLLAHLRDRYGIDAVAATKVSSHNDHVFRVDRRDGDPWIARVFPADRPPAGVEGDAAVLGFLERVGFPAERLAVPDATSAVDGSSVLVTQFVNGRPLPEAVGADDIRRFTVMADLLGRLHSLPLDDSVGRPGGASGEDPSREGSARQDVLASLTFLDAFEAKVSVADRSAFDDLRRRVHAADDGDGLPEATVHGNLLHAPDHVILREREPVVIQWKASGRGRRLADFAYLMWGAGRARLDPDWIETVVRAYRAHVELTDEEVERLEGVMYLRPLYLVCFGYGSGQRASPDRRDEEWWQHIPATAAATRAALRRQ